MKHDTFVLKVQWMICAYSYSFNLKENELDPLDFFIILEDISPLLQGGCAWTDESSLAKGWNVLENN